MARVLALWAWAVGAWAVRAVAHLGLPRGGSFRDPASTASTQRRPRNVPDRATSDRGTPSARASALARDWPGRVALRHMRSVARAPCCPRAKSGSAHSSRRARPSCACAWMTHCDARRSARTAQEGPVQRACACRLLGATLGQRTCRPSRMNCALRMCLF